MIWIWQDNGGIWHDYIRSASYKIEDAFVRFCKSPSHHCVDVDSSRYIDFRTFTQQRKNEAERVNHRKIACRFFFPFEWKEWAAISRALTDQIDYTFPNIEDFMRWFHELVFTNLEVDLKLEGLYTFFTTREENTARFLRQTLPFIIKQVLNLPHLFPSPLLLSRQTQNEEIILTQDQICALQAAAFLVLLPDKDSSFPFCNFQGWYKDLDSCVHTKIESILCYFDQRFEIQSNPHPPRYISIRRQSLPSDQTPTAKSLLECTAPLGTFKVCHNGGICDIGPGGIFTDFANKYIGGGALRHGAVQEEIMFLEKPEMFAALLLCEVMRSNEAVVIRGCQTYVRISGYASSIQFAGRSHQEKEHPILPLPGVRFRDGGIIDTEIVAIDALNFGRDADPQTQYNESETMREIVKCLAGYFHNDEQGVGPSLTPFPRVINYKELAKRVVDEQDRYAAAGKSIDEVDIHSIYESMKEPLEVEDEAEEAVARLAWMQIAGQAQQQQQQQQSKKVVATGNFGCGAFGGDPQFKSMLIWIACTLAERDCYYYSFRNARITELPAVVETLQSRGITVGQLLDILLSYKTAKEQSKSDHFSVFDHILMSVSPPRVSEDGSSRQGSASSSFSK